MLLVPSEKCSEPIDKFETLCHVVVDISNAPCKTSSATGKTGYRRDYNIILLVGLTELKAQVSWIDPTTVRVLFQVPLLICRLTSQLPRVWI